MKLNCSEDVPNMNAGRNNAAQTGKPEMNKDVMTGDQLQREVVMIGTG
jgi:hypothetical protein